MDTSDITPADVLIDALGGTTAVSDMTKCPTSTVHSWRKLGIPEPRFDHMRLAAKERKKDVNFDAHTDAIKERMAAVMERRAEAEQAAA